MIQSVRDAAARAGGALGIARQIPGSTELHLGADARKDISCRSRLRHVALLHFSTHAVADSVDPERSRILLAPLQPGGPADYLFSSGDLRPRPGGRRGWPRSRRATRNAGP